MQSQLVLIACAVLAGLVGSARAGGAGELGRLTCGEEPLELLDGRLRIRMPDGAKVEHRRASSIMAADPSTDDETRVVLESGAEKLVLVIWETFTLAGETFEEEVRKWCKANAPDHQVEAVAFEGGEGAVRGFALVPPKLDATRDAVIARGQFVVLPDKTVLLLTVFVNGKAAEDMDGCTRLARSILQSVQAGERRFAAAAGQRRLGVFSAARGKELAVSVPEGYVLTRQRGVDFLVYRFTKLVPFGQEQPGMGIYYGGHPSPTAPGDTDPEPPEAKPTTVEGELFGAKVSWLAWEVKGPEDRVEKRLEVVCLSPLSGQFREFVHVFAHAPDDKTLAELRGIAETLTVVDRPEPPATQPDAQTGQTGEAP